MGIKEITKVKEYLQNKNIIHSNENCNIEEISQNRVVHFYRIKSLNGQFILKIFNEIAPMNKNYKKFPSYTHYFTEKAAMQYLEYALEDKITPPIVFFDDQQKVICMADLGTTSRIDQIISQGKNSKLLLAALGECIANIHNSSFGNKALPLLFNNDNYLKRIFYLRYYKALTDNSLNKARDQLLQQCAKNRITFVHHNLLKKNFFLLNDRKIFLVDYDQVHYGDPAQDIALFLAEELFWYYNRETKQQRKNTISFWNSYREQLNFREKRTLEINSIKHTGFLLFYLLYQSKEERFPQIHNSVKAKIRENARKIILNPKITKIKYIFKLE